MQIIYIQQYDSQLFAIKKEGFSTSSLPALHPLANGCQINHSEAMPEMYTKQEVDEAIRAAVGPLKAEIRELKGEVGITWIDQEEAQQLTGRSYSWFYQNRTNGTLPIAQMPRTHGSRRVKYSRADCLAYGRKHGQLPPADAA